MLNDNQNNSTGWKTKLDSLNDVCDDTFDRSAAWDKLHHRLTKKPVRKKFGWYWAAAAFLLLIAAIGLLINNDRQPPLVRQTTQPLMPVPARKQGTVKQPVSIIKIIPPVPVESKTPLAKKADQTNKQKSNHEVLPGTVIIENLVVTNDNLPMAPPPLAIIDSVPVANVNTTKVKQTYRVVHINEIIKQTEPSRVARTEKPSFPLKFNAKKFHTEMPVVSAAHSLVTIRLSTQN